MTDHIEFLYDTVVKLRPELKSRRVMVDKEKKLSEFSTADLVAELCSREGVESHSISESYQVSIVHEIECLDQVEVYGPAKIIVVRGE